MLKSKQLLSTGLLFGTLFFTGCFNSNHSDKIKKMFEKQNSKTKTYQTQKPKESKEPKKKNIPVQRQVLQKENHKQILNLEQKIQTLNQLENHNLNEVLMKELVISNESRKNLDINGKNFTEVLPVLENAGFIVEFKGRGLIVKKHTIIENASTKKIVLELT